MFSIQPTLGSAISYGIFLGSGFLLGAVISGYLLALAYLTGTWAWQKLFDALRNTFC
jgi:hypothetical protein